MTLQELKEIYKMVRETVGGLQNASLVFGLTENRIRLYLQTKDQLYPRSKFTINQGLVIWYTRELGYSLHEISDMVGISKTSVHRILDYMDNNDNRDVHPDFSSEDVQKMVNYRKLRYSYKKIASIFSTTIDNIKKALEPYLSSLPKHTAGRKTQIDKNEVNRMIELRKKGYSYTKIAEETNRALSTVFNYINGYIGGNEKCLM